MGDWRDDITGYDIPDDAMLIDSGAFGGFHWIKLETAEQLAISLFRFPHVDIAEMVRYGGIADRSDGREGYYALCDHQGNQHLFGLFLAEGFQYPAVGNPGDTATRIREVFDEPIDFLKHELSGRNGLARRDDALPKR